MCRSARSSRSAGATPSLSRRQSTNLQQHTLSNNFLKPPETAVSSHRSRGGSAISRDSTRSSQEQSASTGSTNTITIQDYELDILNEADAERETTLDTSCRDPVVPIYSQPPEEETRQQTIKLAVTEDISDNSDGNDIGESEIWRWCFTCVHQHWVTV